MAGAVDTWLEVFGELFDPMEKTEFAYNKIRIHGMPGEPAFALAWQAGRERSLDEAHGESRLLALLALH